MNEWRWMGLLLAGLAWLPGCEKAPNATASPPGPPSPKVLPGGYLDHAQPRLPTLKVWLGAQELVTELATTDVQRMTGMMYRTNMATNEAMLFVFPWPHRASFYMKNTTVPLSAAYIDPKGVILEIHDLQPLNETAVAAASDNIQYVLETRQGWFKQNQIGAGTVVRTERGTLQETFFRSR